ncbi:hypothetical protein ACWZEH_34215 (plasmid) [Streptomyces sp. QTS137]
MSDHNAPTPDPATPSDPVPASPPRPQPTSPALLVGIGLVAAFLIGFMAMFFGYLSWQHPAAVEPLQVAAAWAGVGSTVLLALLAMAARR